MNIQLIEEFKLNQIWQEQILAQLRQAFGEEFFTDRIYFKQRAHYRLLATNQNELLGQLGLDYRAMTLGSDIIQVMGIMDFTVDQSHRGKGIGSKMLETLTDLVNQHSDNVDFLMLMADEHAIYLKNGFELKNQEIKWLGIHDHAFVGKRAGKENILMIKAVGEKLWDDAAVLDMLGYMY